MVVVQTMGIKEVFAKQGGMKLIKQYWKSGALFTAGMEFLLLGKDAKALEILRISAEYKAKRKLEKRYIKSLERLQGEYDKTLPCNQSDKVWVCWFQGMENAPDLVKACFRSLKDNLTSREIILITQENMKEYVEFPDFILSKWEKGEITHTHMTDLLRLELLLKYGGTWIDATVYCSCNEQEIPSYFFESNLFFYQALKPGRDGMAAFVSSWYMSACSNNKVLWLTKELCYEYWKAHDSMVDYFLLHDFLCMVLENNEEEWKEIVPKDNSTPHILLLRLFERYNNEMYENVVAQTPFHKLSYKFSDEQKQLDGTYYKHIVGV